MKNQTKKTNHNSGRKIFNIVAVPLVGIIFVGMVIVWVAKLQIQRTAVNDLDKASASLSIVYGTLVKNLAVDTKNTEFSKKCFQASAKFSEGDITCGGDGSFIARDDISLEAQKGISLDLLQNNGSFALKSSEDIKDERTRNTTGFLLRYLHSETGIACSFVLNMHSYTVGCLKKVPAFLPGYTVEK